MPALSAHSVWQNRTRIRVNFRRGTTSSPIAYDTSLYFRHARISVNSTSSHAFVGFASNGNPYSWNDKDAGFAVQNARIRWQDHGNSPLGIAYSQSGSSNLYYVTTPDEGQTFGTSMTIASGLAAGGFFDFEETQDFNRYFYWMEGSSAPYTIYMCVLDAQNNVVKSRTATNLTNADLAPIAVREFPLSGGGRSIGLQYSASSTLTFLTARDAVTFS